MKLVHYTDEPLTKIKYRHQDNTLGMFFKPTGFWVSDDDEYGWKQWCDDAGFKPEGLALAYEITLVKDHNVKIVRTAEGIIELSHLYKEDEDRWSLNWPMMRMRWNGLIITPYQWELRLDPYHSWYYAWDCASGCIWNPTVVASFDQICLVK